MVKLPDKLEVIARVRYHSRGYIALLERNEAYKALAEKQRELAAEVNRAAKYVRSLLPKPLADGPVKIDWKFVPSTQLAGDMFGYHWIDPDHLAIYLLDVSGHGVGSALLAVSAANVIANQGLPGVDVREPGPVLTKLNDMFQMERQDEKYFTIWYGVFRPKDRQLAWSNAGHPPALLHSAAGCVEMEADGLAVGMVPGMTYDTRTLSVPEEATLLVFSDGVFEIEKADSSMWTYSDFAEYIKPEIARGGDLSDRLHKYVRDLGNSEVLPDDFSIVRAAL
jgi:sigma-B regulation protein RsbU (phosphoserine phosphatase)